MSAPCLGVDPGSRSGAAVLLAADGQRVLAWWVWVWMDRRRPMYRVRDHLGGTGLGAKVTERRRVWEIAVHIEGMLYDYARVQVVIEGLFVARRDGTLKVQDVIALAESVGELRAGLGWTGGLPELRPLSREWRKQVLGLSPRTPRKKAEAHAVAWAPRLFDWSAAPWGAHKLTKEERGAIAEAACMARYGVNMRKYDEGLREALEPANLQEA